MAELTVELVAVERRLWSGKATIVIAQTTEGELGILHGHEPMLGELVDGVVLIRTTDGETVAAAVHGGFLSVTGERVSVLAETAELSDEIDVEQAKQALDAADEQERTRAAAQLRAVGEPG